MKIIAFIDCPVFKGNFGLFRQVKKVVRARANQSEKKMMGSYLTIESFVTSLLTFRSGRCRRRIWKSQGPEEAKAKPHLEIFYSLGSFFLKLLSGDSLSWFHGEENLTGENGRGLISRKYYLSKGHKLFIKNCFSNTFLEFLHAF